MRSHPVAFVIATSLGLVACGGGSSKLPNAPTTALRVTPDSGTSGPTTSTPGTVSWSCFANGGLTHAALGNASCGARVTILRTASATAAPVVAPGAPSALSATVSGSVVTLTWTAPTTGDPPTSYLIEAGSAAGRTDIAAFDTGSTATTLAVFNVPAGTYFVRVRGQNSAGTSGPSNDFQLVVGGSTPCASLSAPTGLAGSVTGSTVSLTWTTPSGCAPTSYVIQAGSGPGLANLANFSTGSTATTFFANGVGQGTYFIRVLSTANGVFSPPSNEISVVVGTCGTAPNPPLNLRASATGSTVTIAWDPPATGCAPTSYLLEAGSTSGASNVAVAPVNGTSLTAAGVSNGTYFLRVSSVNAVGQSAASNEVTLVVGPMAPTTLVASFQMFDPSTQQAATDTCRITNGLGSTCTLQSTSFALGTNSIVSYTWSVQYTYGTAKTLTQTSSSPTFSFTDNCGGDGSTSDGVAQPLTVSLTVTDNLGTTATATSGVGSQVPLKIRLFTCGS